MPAIRPVRMEDRPLLSYQFYSRHLRIISEHLRSPQNTPLRVHLCLPWNMFLSTEQTDPTEHSVITSTDISEKIYFIGDRRYTSRAK